MNGVHGTFQEPVLHRMFHEDRRVMGSVDPRGLRTLLEQAGSELEIEPDAVRGVGLENAVLPAIGMVLEIDRLLENTVCPEIDVEMEIDVEARVLHPDMQGFDGHSGHTGSDGPQEAVNNTGSDTRREDRTWDMRVGRTPDDRPCPEAWQQPVVPR